MCRFFSRPPSLNRLDLSLNRKEECHERVCHGTVGLYERAQEILAVADSGGSALVWHIDCVDARLRGRSIYLYSVLMAEACSSIWKYYHCVSLGDEYGWRLRCMVPSR